MTQWVSWRGPGGVLAGSTQSVPRNLMCTRPSLGVPPLQGAFLKVPPPTSCGCGSSQGGGQTEGAPGGAQGSEGLLLFLGQPRLPSLADMKVRSCG